MREEFRLHHPRLEAAIDLSVYSARRIWKWLREQHKAWVAARTRRDLHALSDRILKDIGLRRDQIDRLFH
jgi:uncharacterized protein YjiS (DUF1127 family)